MGRLDSNSSVTYPKSGDSRVTFVKLIRDVLRDEAQKLSPEGRNSDHFENGKWLKVAIEESGERCIDEKELYRTLSNSKQSTGGVSNREWWRKSVIWGFYHYWCKPNFQVTNFFLFVDNGVSPTALQSRVRKGVGFNSDITVTEVLYPEYPKVSEGHKTFINKHFNESNGKKSKDRN